jgi:modulator of FtsH protease HflC
MSKNKLTILGILVIVLGIFAFSSIFTVHQTKQVLVLQFGEWKRTIREPGLNFKLPFLQNIVEYERRILSFDPPAETVILSDQKRMIVDAFVRYQIDDPLKFYKTVRSEAGVLSRLNGVVDSSLRRTLGNVTLLTVLSDERIKIMANIQKGVNEVAQRFGINIIDVRLRRADLPDQAAQAIYARMRSEREREAREARAQGFEKAQQIRSSADRERSVLLAEAEKQSEITRGVGDKTAIKIYADAYGLDPEFYAFYRSMQAYRKAFEGDDTTMVLSPDSEFFRYFGNLSGGPKSGLK